jgi:ABC-type branched-subunit amino acid transport system substrate-binding protein
MRHDLTRRDVLKLGAGVTGAALAGPLRAGAAEGDITLCGIFSQSGAYATFGRDTDRGIKLALSEAGSKALGHDVRYIVRDDQTNPGVGVQ